MAPIQSGGQQPHMSLVSSFISVFILLCIPPFLYLLGVSHDNDPTGNILPSCCQGSPFQTSRDAVDPFLGYFHCSIIILYFSL